MGECLRPERYPEGLIRKSIPVGREGLTVLKSIPADDKRFDKKTERTIIKMTMTTMMTMIMTIIIKILHYPLQY